LLLGLHAKTDLTEQARRCSCSLNMAIWDPQVWQIGVEQQVFYSHGIVERISVCRITI
jgi:hypothetical protein